jgi:hypothetical protein
LFEQETIFVLGAGASWHYGYPTGEQLVLDVIEMAESLRSECEHQLKSGYAPAVPDFVKITHPQQRHQYWSELQNQCDDLVRRLKTVRPLVIDYFLGWNPSLRAIGKLLIAAVILKCEAEYFSEKANVNRRPNSQRDVENISYKEAQRINISAFKDNWYRFITHKLASKCAKSADLFGNKVHFITFNYDFSLEEHIFKSLQAIDIFEDADITRFLGEDRISHVYGSIRSGIPSDEELGENNFKNDRTGFFLLEYDEGPYKSKWPTFLTACELASSKIRTIDSHDKVDDSILSVAKKWIVESDVAYILGYGFDETNSERVGLAHLSSHRAGRRVYFTNFNNANTVNKKIGQLAGSYRSFMEEPIVSNINGVTFEKSTRNVYDALELDFGMT